MPTLAGKTALVTGASRGIGRASALALAAAGAQVLVHYGRGAKEADGVVAEIRKAGGRADAIATDLAAADGAGKLARQARSIVGDRLDILVANAGVSKAATIEETTVEDFDKLFAVNVRAPFFLVQQLLPIMCEGKQHRFPLVARGARRCWNAPAYAATKGAVDTLVKHFASMLGARGIRVNAVAPGVVETDMSNFTKTDAGRDFALGMQALKRLAQPDDIGGVVAFLASEDARWITGDTIHVDGGSKLCRQLQLRRISHAIRHRSGRDLPRLRTLRSHRETPQALRPAGAASDGARTQPRRLLSQGPPAGRRLVQLHREMEVGYCRLVTISTDNIAETNEYRTGVGAHWPFLSDARRTVQKDLDIAEYTDPAHNPMIPHVIVLEPGLVVYKIYNGYWFFGRPTMEDLRQDLRAVTKKCRPDWDITTPELKAAWKQGRKDLFYPYGKTYAQTLGEQD